jgi:hypothetical protein
MKAIHFKGVNAVFGVGQDDYLDLPAHKDKDGIVTTCYKLTLRERLRVLFDGKIWFSVMTFNNPLQPQRPSVREEFEDDN